MPDDTEKLPTDPDPSVPAAETETAPEQAAVVEAAPAMEAAPPPAATEVMEGKVTEQTADLDRRMKEIVARESKVAEKEARLQRKAQALSAPEKKSFMSGNALFD